MNSISYATQSYFGGTSLTQIPLTSGTGAAAGEEGVSGQVLLAMPHLIKRTRATVLVHHTNGSGNPISCLGGGERTSAAAVNAVQFKFSSGSIDSGTISMYGMRNA